MTDRREEILARLEVVLDGIDGLSCRRMTADVRPTDRPTTVLLDGDEEARENHHEIEASVRVTMRPQVLLYVATPAELNPARLAIIKAIAGDATLKGLCDSAAKLPGRRYLGCETQVQRGEGIEADMALAFAFTYLLQPEKL